MDKMLKRYDTGDARMQNKAKEFAEISKSFYSAKGRCLQVGFRGKPYGSNWDVLDLYDNAPEVNITADIMDTGIPDETYDLVVAFAILEHVEYPRKAVDEMFRILKRGGRVCVGVPFNQPYHPSPRDFYRWTPDGILLLMDRFKPIETGYFRIENSKIYNGVFFYGER